jgi:hypothetical protein
MDAVKIFPDAMPIEGSYTSLLVSPPPHSSRPNADGYYGLYMDGHLVHQSNNIVYRNTEKLQISGLFFRYKPTYILYGL